MFFSGKVLAVHFQNQKDVANLNTYRFDSRLLQDQQHLKGITRVERKQKEFYDYII